jgi:hypothetical protein
MDIKDFKEAEQIQYKLSKYREYLDRFSNMEGRTLYMSSILNTKYIFKIDMDDEVIQNWIDYLIKELKENIESLEEDFKNL